METRRHDLTFKQLSDLLSYEDAITLEKVAKESQKESRSMTVLSVSIRGTDSIHFLTRATDPKYKGCKSSQGFDDYQSCVSTIYYCCCKLSLLHR
jgi:hypothetical protein